MDPYIILFLLHFISYWGTCFVLDDLYYNYIDLRIPITESIRNQFCVTLPTLYLFSTTYPVDYDNFMISILYIPALICFADVYFYSLHRLCHSSPLLWSIHKYHHHGVIRAVKALDAHYIEHFVINLGSVWFGVFLFQQMNIIINMWVLYSWMILTTTNTCVTHSENFRENGKHIIHHKKLTYNYGVGFYCMDRMCRTYCEL